MYTSGLLKQTVFDIPVISVGNLSIGGTGKTPHVEHLIRLLSPYLHIAILSRGYKRQTTGFILGTPQLTAADIGDEPLQYIRKFPNISVAVGERRAYAIPQLLRAQPDIQTILLDDAYQHLPVKPGLQILTTPYSLPYWEDQVLPAGRLREWRTGARRADIIIVSKCPSDLSTARRDELLKRIKPKPHQQVFFSYYTYGQPYLFEHPEQRITLTKQTEVLAVTGIADESYLVNYLSHTVARLKLMAFGDHHQFDHFDVGRIAGIFDEQPRTHNRIILTTEKDATRLEAHKEFIAGQELPLYIIPIEVSFLFDNTHSFDETIKNWLLAFQS
jgi:tetraacyldisaccharide 4'-kinase